MLARVPLPAPSRAVSTPGRLRIPAVLLALLCGALSPAIAAAAPIAAIGVENQYADVIRQVGGADVAVQAIETDPNTDPHAFEVSPRVAGRLSSARLVVQNGVGYDSWATRIMAASPDPARRVIVVQALLGLSDNAPNPHLWYDPDTMPAVAHAVADALAAIRPEHAAAFHAAADRFTASLRPWRESLAGFRAAHPGIPVAVTEPVANFMLQAAGFAIATPFGLQAAIMNGTDPSPQDVAAENALLAGRRVRALVYNQQVTDSLTQSFLKLAQANHVPVVGVYETMPTPGFDYQSWMRAEFDALRAAVLSGRSTASITAR